MGACQQRECLNHINIHLQAISQFPQNIPIPDAYLAILMSHLVILFHHHREMVEGVGVGVQEILECSANTQDMCVHIIVITYTQVNKFETLPRADLLYRQVEFPGGFFTQKHLLNDVCDARSSGKVFHYRTPNGANTIICMPCVGLNKHTCTQIMKYTRTCTHNAKRRQHNNMHA